MRRLRAVCAFGIVAVVCAAPAAFGQDQARQAQQATAKIVDPFAFAPLELTVELGTTVTWTNESDRPHTVTDRGGTFDTQPIAPTKTGSVTFSVPGRYSYFCRINPGPMNATIVVKPGSQPSRTARIQALDPGRPNETLRFDPNDPSVQTATTIVFANVGGKPHTLTADDGSFDTGIVTPGAEGGKFAGTSATITVSKPGLFPFHCEVHPTAMKGVLTVTGEERKGLDTASSAPRDLTVSIRFFEFAPKQASVAPGGSVTWRNNGNVAHTATFDQVDAIKGLELDTKRIEPSRAAKLAAPQAPGSYAYRCTIHPDKMRGVLVVVGQNVADPTESAAAKAPLSATGGGSRGAVTFFALLTGIGGAFLGGFGISAFARNKMGAGS